MTSTVRESLAKASRTSDKLAALLCAAGSAEVAAELSGRLSRMSDDARVLAGALERLALQDADAKERVKAERERERYHQKKAQAVEAAVEIAAEAAQSAAEQATSTTPLFINWALPMVEDVNEPEAEEAQNL